MAELNAASKALGHFTNAVGWYSRDKPIDEARMAASKLSNEQLALVAKRRGKIGEGEGALVKMMVPREQASLLAPSLEDEQLDRLFAKDGKETKQVVAFLVETLSPLAAEASNNKPAAYCYL